jgi:hypothetical protein
MSIDNGSYLKNCPILNSNTEQKLIDQCKFNFDEQFYQQFKSFMIQNPGKTTQELCSLIQFYNFTPQTLPIAFKMFNTYKNTYFDICGPFIFKNNRWFPVYSKKYTDTIILAQENSYLRNQINQYKNQINQYKNQFN